MFCIQMMYFVFFFNDTATTEIYTLSLHDALPICKSRVVAFVVSRGSKPAIVHQRQEKALAHGRRSLRHSRHRSEEHTSELQSRQYLVCRLLLEKKKLARLRQRHQVAVRHRARTRL